MRNYTLEVLGTEVSFKAQADPRRVEQARDLLDERYKILKEHGRQLSKDKLLTFLALAVADDMLQARDDLDKMRERIKKLVDKIENTGL